MSDIERLTCSCGVVSADAVALEDHVRAHRHHAFPLTAQRLTASDRRVDERRRQSRKKHETSLPSLAGVGLDEAVGFDDATLQAELTRVARDAEVLNAPPPPERRDLSPWPVVATTVGDDYGSLLGPIDDDEHHDLVQLGDVGDRIQSWRRVLFLDLIRRRRIDLEDGFAHAGILVERLTVRDLNAIEAAMRGILKQLGALVISGATEEEVDAVLEGVAIDNANMDQLTEREREVIDCLARGLPEKEVATELSISPAGVRDVVKTVSERLGAHGHVEMLRCLGVVRGIDTP